MIRYGMCPIEKRKFLQKTCAYSMFKIKFKLQQYSNKHKNFVLATMMLKINAK
jgi:hypothetical protein